MRGRITAVSLLSAATLIVGLTASAQELVYEPINPSFGGDSFNSSHLLAIANSQNDYRDPNQSSATNSQADQFVRQLQSRLLSSLAGEVNDAIFGDNPQQSGTITFGDQIIEFSRGLDAVHLTITDVATGTVTEIEIPLLYAGDATTSADSSFGAIMASQAQSEAAASPADDPFTSSLAGDVEFSGGIF